jgi:hypothetical protein
MDDLADTLLRISIGKADNIDDLRVGLCSHQMIAERERDLMGFDPTSYCRRCGVSVQDQIRCNDYLTLRNPQCRGPICYDCTKDGGDVFYRSFLHGRDTLDGWNALHTVLSCWYGDRRQDMG